jgi:tRNA (cmo5U34)-methyltransferase
MPPKERADQVDVRASTDGGKPATHGVDRADSLDHSLDHAPGERWEFDDDVARVFDDMLARSIPELAVLRGLVFDTGRRYVVPGTAVVDLGCSRGESLAPLLAAFRDGIRAVGIETSPPMLDACRARFAAEIAAGTTEVLDLDLGVEYPDVTASLTLCVLTLQFRPVEARARVMHDAFASTVPGGALVLAEKLRGATPELDAQWTEQYEAMKRANGYTQEAIDRKRLSLEGVLVPLTERENTALLHDAGFAVVEMFWRHLNFAAWLAVKS